jgi:hypothetical protein
MDKCPPRLLLPLLVVVLLLALLHQARSLASTNNSVGFHLIGDPALSSRCVGTRRISVDEIDVL